MDGTTTNQTTYAYANRVKQLVLESPLLFTSGKQNAIWFEKRITSHTIADCLIHTPNAIIGVEIKSAHDSKARLRRQLTDYVKVCDYTWVLIHDLKYTEVEPILADFPTVGVICYTEVSNDYLAPGVIKQPLQNKTSLDLQLKLLWSIELQHLVDILQQKYHKPLPAYTGVTKYKVRMAYLKSFPGTVTHDALCNLLSTGYLNPERRFTAYDFKYPQRSGDGE